MIPRHPKDTKTLKGHVDFKKKIAIVNRYIEICSPVQRIENSPHGLLTRSLELDNLFSQIAIHSLDLPE